MCGIAGAIGFVDESIVEAVGRMKHALLHRGPDAGGCARISINDATSTGVVLGHRRLSIIDLAEHANQPMHDARTGNVLIYNGEVYNFRELRSELETEGATFETQSDTEVVLKAYSRWGDACAERFRGMFALALWDARAQQLVLMRDRLGIKPLYVARLTRGDKVTVLLASEVRALLESGLIDRRLNAQALETYLWNGFVAGRQSIIDGVELLPAGTVATCDPAGNVQEQKFWSLDSAQQPGETDTAALGEELRQAVATRLISDVPLGVFLSGGVDSSAVAALAAQASGSPVRTFNIAFDEAAFDESQYARVVAERLGTDHEEIRLTESIFRSGLDNALSCIDQPTFDAINTYFVSDAVRKAGLTVALAGTGGDELFGGYSSFVDLPHARRWSRRLNQLPRPLRNALADVIIRLKTGTPGAVPPQIRWGKLHDVLDAEGDLLKLYQVSYSLFTQDFLSQLRMRRDSSTEYGLPNELVQQMHEAIESIPELSAISRLELSSFIGQRLLRDTDSASMAVSLEVRVPLLDHRVVEEADRLDPSIRHHPLGRKQLFKRLAMPELDHALFDRPKAGFVLPIEQWTRSAVREQVDALLTDAALCESAGLNAATVSRLWQAFQADAPGLYWSRIWSIFVLLWWCRTYRVSL